MNGNTIIIIILIIIYSVFVLKFTILFDVIIIYHCLNRDHNNSYEHKNNNTCYYLIDINYYSYFDYGFKNRGK